MSELPRWFVIHIPEEKAMFSRSRWPGGCALLVNGYLIKGACGVAHGPILMRPARSLHVTLHSSTHDLAPRTVGVRDRLITALLLQPGNSTQSDLNSELLLDSSVRKGFCSLVWKPPE